MRLLLVVRSGERGERLTGWRDGNAKWGIERSVTVRLVSFPYQSES